MNKQIEEIAKTCPYNVRGRCGLDETICTTDCEVAIWGYEKASDVAREIFAEIKKLFRQRISDEVDGVYRIYEQDFAELRKKYESEGADDE